MQAERPHFFAWAYLHKQKTTSCTLRAFFRILLFEYAWSWRSIQEDRFLISDTCQLLFSHSYRPFQKLKTRNSCVLRVSFKWRASREPITWTETVLQVRTKAENRRPKPENATRANQM